MFPSYLTNSDLPHSTERGNPSFLSMWSDKGVIQLAQSTLLKGWQSLSETDKAEAPQAKKWSFGIHQLVLSGQTVNNREESGAEGMEAPGKCLQDALRPHMGSRCYHARWLHNSLNCCLNGTVPVPIYCVFLPVITVCYNASWRVHELLLRITYFQPGSTV